MMKKMIDIKVKDQFSQIVNAKAFLREVDPQALELENIIQKIEHIVIDDEIILPTIELLFESKNSSNIYRVIEEH